MAKVAWNNIFNITIVNSFKHIGVFEEENHKIEESLKE